MTTFTPPPTYADPTVPNPLDRNKSQFNPIWLKWFLDIAQYISNSGTGRLHSTIPITSTAIYQPSQGVNNVVVFAQGPGGNGGTPSPTGAGQICVTGGGGAGALGYGLYSSGFSGLTVTIDNASSSFGGLLVANKGSNGQSSGATGTTPIFAYGGVGGTSTGGQLNGVGPSGDVGIAFSLTQGFGGKGADSWFGGGGVNSNAAGYGAGGSGVFVPPNTAAPGVFLGTKGFVLIFEYS